MKQITFHPSSSKSHTFHIDRIIEVEREDNYVTVILSDRQAWTVMEFKDERSAKSAAAKIAKAMDEV